MAGDWIKMRVGLRSNAKTIAMSRTLAQNPAFIEWWTGPELGCDGVTNGASQPVTMRDVPRVTVSGLLDVWGHLNVVVNDQDEVPFMALEDIDSLAEIPGFGAAMAKVGWVEEMEEGGLRFPNFKEFNVPSNTRGRAKTGAERTREWRERKEKENLDNPINPDGVTLVTSRDAEKRREEKSISTSTPQPPGETSNGELDLDGGEESKPGFRTAKGKLLSPAATKRFEEFWKVFDYKKGKAAAGDSWYRLEPMENGLFDRVIEGAKREAEGRQALLEAGKTPKYAQGWITGRRWEDAVDPPAKRGDSKPHGYEGKW